MALSAKARSVMPTSFASGAVAKELADALDAVANLNGVLASQTEIDRAADVSARIVSLTTATLTLTVAAHDGKTVVLDSTHTQTVTLSAASGSGARFRLRVAALGTDGSKIIKVANVTDAVQGVAIMMQTDVTAQANFGTTATDDTITFNNTTQGGLIGTTVEIEDIKTGVFAVSVVSRVSGIAITPFSASV